MPLSQQRSQERIHPIAGIQRHRSRIGADRLPLSVHLLHPAVGAPGIPHLPGGEFVWSGARRSSPPIRMLAPRIVREKGHFFNSLFDLSRKYPGAFRWTPCPGPVPDRPDALGEEGVTVTGFLPATGGRCPFSSNEMTPNRPVPTMSRRWMSASGIPGGRQERIGLSAVPAAWASAVCAFAGGTRPSERRRR